MTGQAEMNWLHLPGQKMVIAEIEAGCVRHGIG
jgi:hypothetical protein